MISKAKRRNKAARAIFNLMEFADDTEGGPSPWSEAKPADKEDAEWIASQLIELADAMFPGKS